jgi:integrase
MARKRQDSRISTRSARTSLRQRSEPYWRSISKGLSVGYRRGANGGTWIVRHFSVDTGRKIEALGIADDFADADGIRVLSFDQAQSAAREWWNKKLQEHSGELVSGHYTVGMAMDDYIGDSENSKRKKLPKTRLIIESHIKPTLGGIELAKLTHRRVKAWRDALATTAPRLRTRPGKPQAYRDVDMSNPDILRARQATANRVLTVLKAALNYAESESRRITTDAAWVDVKPYSDVDVPKVRFLTMNEVTAFTPVCESDFQKLVEGALVSGCRYGELTAMKVNAFDAGQGTVYVAESKNGESRYVELNDEGIALFKTLTQDRDADETMFLRSNGKSWKQSEQQRPMDAACDAAKLEGVTFHILRRTYASHAVMNGMPIKVLADNLGHKDTRITERHYAHLSKSYKQKLIRENAPTFGFGRPHLVKSA